MTIDPRETILRVKRANGGLLPMEEHELYRLERQRQLAAENASNQLHDERTEARSFPPDRINFHDL
jgi:hypothetical protein